MAYAISFCKTEILMASVPMASSNKKKWIATKIRISRYFKTKYMLERYYETVLGTLS